MILVTAIESCENVSFLSGILLDPITETDFRKDVFTAFLISDRVRQVVCELPKYEGGIGSTAQGHSIGAFTTKLFGTCQYRIRGGQNIGTILSDIVSNQIKRLHQATFATRSFPRFYLTKKLLRLQLRQM
jgi:hypothetical protein